MLGDLGMHEHHLLDHSIYLHKGMPIGATAHQAGTVRFGTDPRSSALDVNCKAHDLDNLYVVDTSFFPSIGAVNPSLTAIANALGSATTSPSGLAERHALQPAGDVWHDPSPDQSLRHAMDTRTRPQVVIVGGGFAGCSPPGRCVGPRRRDPRGPRGHHLFQPLLYQCATGSPSEVRSRRRCVTAPRHRN